MRGTAGGGPRTAPAVTALTPKDVFGILRRHVFLIISLTILGLVIGGAGFYLLKKYSPKYTAQTFIEVLPPVETDPMTISSNQVDREIQYGYRVSMASLITQQSTLQSLVDRPRIQDTEWFRSFGEVRGESIVKAVDDLRRHFSAVAQRDGAYISVSMVCNSAEESALIVNEMVDLFLASQRTSKKGDISERLVQLQNQRDDIQRDIDTAERALADVRRRWNLTDLEEAQGQRFQHTITQKLNNLEIEQNNLMLEMRQVQASVGNAAEMAQGAITEQVENMIESDPTVVMLTQRIATQEMDRAALLTKFGPNHRIVRQLQNLIEETREKRSIRRKEIAEQTRKGNLQRSQDYLVVLQEKYAELERLRQEAEAKQNDLDLARVQYQQRASIRDERKDMLDSIKEQIEKLKILLVDPESPKVQFVGSAPIPLEMSSPRWEFYLPGGTMFGFMLGIGFAFLIELLNDIMRTPRDVSRYLNIPLLGNIPDANQDDQVEDVDLYHVVRQAPYSIVSESYRRLRTNLKLSGPSESLKVLLVTSGAAGDGKTSVAVNLAMTFVAENKKVLLIDANFWQPALRNIFPRAEEKPEQADFGLSNLLTGRCDYMQVVRSGGVDGLYLIDSGSLPPNPAELLGEVQMKQLIEQQKANYDYIIIDGPPLLLVSVTKILAKFADGTVLVFNAAATKRGAAQRAVKELKEVDADLIGCVLFGVKAMKGGYFHEQFKSYQKYQKLQLANSI